jgi:hypothetical protein
MAGKELLTDWVVEAIRIEGGSASLLEVAKHVWRIHEAELREAGDLFYTWQYDMRWAATRLRKQGELKPADDSPRGIWELA